MTAKRPPGLPWPARVALWDRALGAVRDRLRAAGMREVSTPVRVAAVAIEPFIEPLTAPPGYLATSPELAMKRLLCRGSGSIFQISHVFRAAELGDRHAEEFHLVEWYRVDDELAAARADVEALVDVVLAAAGRPAVSWSTFAILDVVAATLGRELRGDEDAEALVRVAASVDLELRDPGLAARDPDVRRLAAWTAFFSEWSDRDLDPWLRDRGGGVHLCDFPPALAALAEVRDVGGARLAARFESYVDGVELANGYQELRDPAEQAARFAAVSGLRDAHQLPALPIDERFLGDLRGFGLPRCAGVALGLDRLLMIAAAAERLSDISLALGSPGR
ncbi:MAG: amino acid--tRNA ligase-related protein [Nannocystaceae bacterium]